MRVNVAFLCLFLVLPVTKELAIKYEKDILLIENDNFSLNFHCYDFRKHLSLTKFLTVIFTETIMFTICKHQV